MKMGKVEKSLKLDTYITRRKLNPNKEDNENKKRKDSIRRVSLILKKSEAQRTPEENGYLESYDEVVTQISKRKERIQLYKDRVVEKEDPIEFIERKAEKLAEIISRAKHLVCYTGAGISTSARIPDYRGSNGIWTLLQQGKEIGPHDLSLADPTFTHMALYELHRRKMLRFVVSQNCDGLHLRAGLPKGSLSEVHGNMYIEACKNCKPNVEYWRLFDTTELTSRFYHKTNRRCHLCDKPLIDTIVHFGERGNLKWPLNWAGACSNAEKADVILCLGSSLKVLKKYSWLWQMDRSQKKRAKICIVNLQWTPKDKLSTIKINGKCDDVMRLVMKNLNINVPLYDRRHDPIFAHASLLCPEELHTVSQPMLKINNDSSNNIDKSNRTDLNNKCTEQKHSNNRFRKLPPPLLPIKKRSYIKTNINSRHLIMDSFDSSTSSSSSDSEDNSSKYSDQFSKENKSREDHFVNDFCDKDKMCSSNEDLSKVHGINNVYSTNINRNQIIKRKFEVNASNINTNLKNGLSKTHEDLTSLFNSNCNIKSSKFRRRAMSDSCFKLNQLNFKTRCDIFKQSLDNKKNANSIITEKFVESVNATLEEINLKMVEVKTVKDIKKDMQTENKLRSNTSLLDSNQKGASQNEHNENGMVVLANKNITTRLNLIDHSNMQIGILKSQNVASLSQNSDNETGKLRNLSNCNEMQNKAICDITNHSLAFNHSMRTFDHHLIKNALRLFKSHEPVTNPSEIQLKSRIASIESRHFFGISSIEITRLASSNEYYKKFLEYCQAVDGKMPYWYEVGYAYSGLHSIIQPPPPEINIWGSITVPIFEMNRKEAECDFCFDTYAEFTCQFYRKYKPEFFTKKYRNDLLVVCECCDYSDNDMDNTTNIITKKGDKRAKLDLPVFNDSSQTGRRKIQAGWYGKGYRKNRKKKK